MTVRSQPYRLKWPLTPSQVEGIDEMFQILFKSAKTGGVAGADGTIGVNGAQGATGRGVPGIDGVDGVDGFPGPAGQLGATGPPGAQGTTGMGVPGQDGDNGFDGWPGPMGPAGASGGSGSFALLEQHTAAASATLDFTTAITALYDTYFIQFVDILPATNAVGFTMTVSTNAGVSYDTATNYASSYNRWSKTGASTDGSASGSSIDLGGALSLSNDTTEQGLSGHAILANPLGVSGWKKITGAVTWWYDGTPELLGASINAAYKSATAVNALRFKMSSGNIASGTIRVYGLAK